MPQSAEGGQERLSRGEVSEARELRHEEESSTLGMAWEWSSEEHCWYHVKEHGSRVGGNIAGHLEYDAACDSD